MVNTHYPLGDNIGSVQNLDHMGSDLTVVNAARVSMHKESSWGEHGDIKWLVEDDIRLIKYLAKHNHFTPFTHPQVTLRIKMPIFIARQWFKHQVGFTRNEVSRRYVDDTPEFFIPAEWRKRAANVKQGSSDEPFVLPMWLAQEVIEFYDKAEAMYLTLLNHDVCPEQARIVLPQGAYTEFIETGSLAAYARLCNLRLDPHAQKEVRLYAEAVYKIIKELFPVSAGVLVKENT
jgi:thymidylate synthase (FAD)